MHGTSHLALHVTFDMQCMLIYRRSSSIHIHVYAATTCDAQTPVAGGFPVLFFLPCYVPGFGHDSCLPLDKPDFIFCCLALLLRSGQLMREVLTSPLLLHQVLLQPSCLHSQPREHIA